MEDLQPLFGQNQECHLCKNKFITMNADRKFIKVDWYDTDFCPIYKEDSINGLLYKIFVCPKCGYSFSTDFSSSFPPGTKAILTECITKKWSPFDFAEKEV